MRPQEHSGDPYSTPSCHHNHGPTRSSAAECLKRVSIIAEKNPHFVLLDENKSGNHDYDDKMALNTDHLSVLGASQLTSRLDSILKTLK